MSSSLRILLVAEAANPEFVSVPLVGWSHALAIMNVTKSHLVTQIRNKQAIERYGMRDGIEFTAIDSERVARKTYAISKFLRKIGFGWTATTALSTIAYYSFESMVWDKFKDQLKAGEFDIVHRLTPLSPATPSYTLSRNCAKIGVPFILGPLNGGVPWPKGYGSARRSEGEWLSYLRSAYKLLPGYRSTMKCSSAIITGSYTTRGQISKPYQAKCVYMPENGIQNTKPKINSYTTESNKLQMIFVGRLVPCKGVENILMASVPFIKQGKANLHIVGDGAGMAEIKNICEREELGSGVRFYGWLKHSEVLQILADCDLFMFPSIRDFGGGAVLEAMAMGVVPVVVDYAGPGELVTESTGFKIPIGTPDNIVANMKEIIASVIHDPENLQRLSDSGQRYIDKHFLWSAKAKKTLSIYKWILQHKNCNPELDDEFLSCPRPAGLVAN